MVVEKPLENEEKFRYLGTTVTNQNSIHEKINSRINSRNAGYHLVHNLVSPYYPKDTKIKIHRTIILPFVL
jgi:L-lysine 2,3-aminomutase